MRPKLTPMLAPLLWEALEESNRSHRWLQTSWPSSSFWALMLKLRLLYSKKPPACYQYMNLLRFATIMFWSSFGLTKVSQKDTTAKTFWDFTRLSLRNTTFLDFSSIWRLRRKCTSLIVLQSAMISLCSTYLKMSRSDHQQWHAQMLSWINLRKGTTLEKYRLHNHLWHWLLSSLWWWLRVRMEFRCVSIIARLSLKLWKGKNELTNQSWINLVKFSV